MLDLYSDDYYEYKWQKMREMMEEIRRDTYCLFPSVQLTEEAAKLNLTTNVTDYDMILEDFECYAVLDMEDEFYDWFHNNAWEMDGPDEDIWERDDY